MEATMTHTALSDAALAQAWIDSCIALKAIEHVGAHNRFVTTVVALEKEMLARCGGRPDLFEPILSNEDPAVRMAASYQFREAKPELFRAVMTELSSQPGEIGQDARYSLATMDAPTPIYDKSEAPRSPHTYWQANNPPTEAMTRDEIEQRLRVIAPDCCDQLMNFARPAIGLWPQRPRADLPVTASKLGGMPYAPRGFEWPVAATEPMLFLGQINCADLKGFPGAEQLPRRVCYRCSAITTPSTAACSRRKAARCSIGLTPAISCPPSRRSNHRRCLKSVSWPFAP
jgi:hypothetical protein